MAAPASGGLELSELIKSMTPSLHTDTFVFAHISHTTGGAARHHLLEGFDRAEMLFREEEGWTVIVTQAVADELDLDSIFLSRKITLNVHSSLDAVGFMAAIATRLATLGTGVNPVSGYYHDHLFVPVGKEDRVMEELKAMAAEHQ